MIDILKIVTIISLNLCIYYFCGEWVCKGAKIAGNILEKMIIGFFLYFALFQMVVLPAILMQGRMRIVVDIWSIVLLLIVCAGIYLLKQRKKGIQLEMKRNFNFLLVILTGLLIALQIYYMVRNGYNGWDTAYYVGTMNTTMQTDTMYIYNGNDGIKEATIDFRYALSGFYMYGVVMCRIFKMHVLLYCRYVIPTILSILSNAILFELGMFLSKDRGINYALEFVLFADVLNFAFVSTYSTSEFLLTRGIEAKGYCSNVIIPAIFLIVLHLNEECKSKKYWLFLLIVSIACNAVSFSSVLLVPALMTITVFALFFMKREIGILWRYGMVMIVPSVYAMVYFLFTKNLLMIKVR